MFKQPAENTNATPVEEQRSAERVNPEINPAEEHAEIEAEAKRLAAERGSEGSYSDEDWSNASRIVRNRKISLSKA
ncbi:MAG TPA: hypothetical protein VER03_02290 [Bryobacteraceae bacterium]|nr:hypothetical protein [Bryobacteraceae bacterium]